MQSSFKKHIIYWILPSLVTVFCIFIYFFDLFGLSHWIAHPINREFGVVENLQLILLAAICVIAVKGARKNANSSARNCFRIMAAGCVLLFLEEIDYGLHYVDYFTSYKAEAAPVMQIDYNTELRNIHNNGKITSVTKTLSYAVIVILFVIIPLLPASFKERFQLYKYLSPSRMIVMTAISLLLVNHLALHFYNNYDHHNRALNGNISEFEEIMTYYIFLLYLVEMAYSQKPSLLFEYYRRRKSGKANVAYDQPGNIQNAFRNTGNAA